MKHKIDIELQQACEELDGDSVNRLLGLGANPNYLGTHGRPPLLHALFAALKMKYGVSRSSSRQVASDVHGKTYEATLVVRRPLFTLVRRPPSPLVGIVQSLVNAGADVNAADTAGTTPLMVAAGMNLLSCVETLCQANADVNAMTYNKCNALHCGAGSDKRILQLLLNRGADPNSRNMSSGITSLMTAAFTNKLENVRLLVAAGADVGATDNSGRTALDHASGVRARSIVRYLKTLA